MFILWCFNFAFVRFFWFSFFIFVLFEYFYIRLLYRRLGERLQTRRPRRFSPWTWHEVFRSLSPEYHCFFSFFSFAFHSVLLKLCMCVFLIKNKRTTTTYTAAKLFSKKKTWFFFGEKKLHKQLLISHQTSFIESFGFRTSNISQIEFISDLSRILKGYLGLSWNYLRWLVQGKLFKNLLRYIYVCL